MRTKNLMIVSVLLIAALITGCSGAAFAQGTTPTPDEPGEGAEVTRTLSVTGSGRALITPDIAYINVGVQTESAQAQEAVSENSEQTQEVIDAVTDMGIAARDIQTTNFSIYPRQDFDREGNPTGEITYVVNNTVAVTIRNLDNVGPLLDAVVGAGANTIHGIRFDVSDRTGALSAAREQAVNNARAQAEELAAAAGVDLGAVQSITSYGGYTPVPIEYARGMQDMAASVPISAGDMEVSVEVNMVFAIQ